MWRCISNGHLVSRRLGCSSQGYDNGERKNPMSLRTKHSKKPSRWHQNRGLLAYERYVSRTGCFINSCTIAFAPTEVNGACRVHYIPFPSNYPCSSKRLQNKLNTVNVMQNNQTPKPRIWNDSFEWYLLAENLAQPRKTTLPVETYIDVKLLKTR